MSGTCFQGQILRSGLTHPRRNLRFSNENVQLLGGNFYGRIFTRRELSSRRECYQDFASRQDSRRDPGEDFFFFLAGSRQVQISRRDSCRDTRREFFLGRIPPGKRATSARSRRDPGRRRESWRDPGEIPVPILQGLIIMLYMEILRVNIEK